MTFDLCDAQEGLWLAQLLAPQNPLFNTGQYITLNGPLDRDIFAQAHARTMTEADALRLRISARSGRAQQSLSAPTPVLEIVDLRGAPDPHAQALAAMQSDSDTPIDPATDPLARFILFVLTDTRHLWYERLHHLAIDGFGMVLLTNQVAAHYSAALAGKAAPQPLAPLAQALEADASYRASTTRHEDAAYWHGIGATLGTPASPSPRSAPRQSSDMFLRLHAEVPATTAQKIAARARQLRLGWPDVLTLFTAAYLRRVSPSETGEAGDDAARAVFGLPFMARFGSAAARVPCMWMNVLPYQLDLSETDDLDTALTRASAPLVQGRKHGQYRSETLRRDLGRTGVNDRLYGPLINVQPFDIAPRFAGISSRLHILSAGPVDDLTVSFRGNDTQGMTVEIDANPALYDTATIRAHLARLLTFLDGASTAARLCDVASVTPAEHQRLIKDLNATDHPVPATTLTALIEAQMQATPDAPAVAFGTSVLSYRELDQRSRALAQQLVARGAGKDRLVAVALERSPHLAVALVAILRAGAAYVPLDPAQPGERLKALIAQTTPVALLAEHELDAGLAPLCPADWPQEPSDAALPVPAPHDLAYVLFTSGSTGAPKGVMIEHDAIVNRLLWMRDTFGFSHTDRILQKTPATFDVSVWEFFLPYLCGGTLVFAAPDAHRDPAALAQTIRTQAISVLHFVPSMLSAFLDHPDSLGLSLRQVFCSGEELTAPQRDRFHARICAQLHNLYGPTEAAVDVTWWNASAGDTAVPLPIGHPVWNTQLYVLDAEKRPVPEGVAGELYLGGRQLARGYLGRDDLTRARFVPSPFEAGARLYATGDLACIRPDGALIYLGRNDQQVKIRGMRVEPEEVAAVLRQIDGVSQAVVLARRDLGPKVHLVGYVVADAAFDSEAARIALGARLPAHMVPSALVTVAQFATTANGKLDRKALPAPPRAAATGTPCQTPLERQIATVMRATLALDDLPLREADFFALGGDSLSALQLLLGLEDLTGRRVPLGQIFETPQIYALANALGQQEKTHAGLDPLLPLSRGASGAPALFLLHPAGGLAWGYRSLARALSETTGCSVIGLQSPVLTGAAIPATLTALCRSYADLVEAQTPSGTIHLGGWSLGGILAQDIAVELRERGRSIGAVLVLDAYPAQAWRNEPVPDPVTALRALLAIAGFDPAAHPDLDTRAKVVDFLTQNARLLGTLPRDVLDAVVRLVTGTNALMRAHEQRMFDGTLTHIRAANDHSGRDLSAAMWAPYCRDLHCLELPCLHKDMVAPAQVDAIAAGFQAALANGPFQRLPTLESSKA
ncbi:Enterobactin synthase component F [Aquimixticola soesokkakensis]|uniref:Enterobactin synthase component F n=1 Tax=Aquimixticola soesokkakensis TaxID=1519096 RepID=A0A1Y5T6P4_9RHOB|nr:non-ribosomal peptide synthetase [Aquimixticola soesokkakensis]SLN56797.1 Enterobactin synthase component F [Aquimixticola soesokkakensis]